VLVSELSGASNIAAKAGKKFNIENDKEMLRKVLARVQDLESVGFQFEAAEASFELLVRKQIGQHRTFFELDHYHVSVIKNSDQTPVAESTLKLRVGDVSEHRVAEGSGPVDSLDRALRKALQDHHPSINDLRLVDYKVRVVNTKEETAAAVRVTIEWKRRDDNANANHEKTPQYFGTIGVSSNIIDATWQALVDGYEYHLIHVGSTSV